ncbi:nuclear transport factor 2 family protein [Conexibacter sp. CPCC 206217]|uniref:nuclear transport factor 2 family protein n=1 Tax=Conexibacter sp. CPCC 206217 TaxID=3064574 RepID=UPI00271D8F04|nr:nuclear transport factor 2 family protein [Conexibacter sp. CPCC 206217]MDO8212401.1 nuclear transport factor 2 family protein [Conexibacter sp. CPCC 206217]
MTDLERVLAERACERLIVEYARRVDFGEASGIADLFTDDGRWQGTELVLDGREQIRAWFTRREGLARRVSRHVFTNLAVELLSADEAVATSYMVNYRHDRADGDTSLPVPARAPKYVGECHDRFRRTPDGWRFAERRVEVSFVRPRGG